MKPALLLILSAVFFLQACSSSISAIPNLTRAPSSEKEEVLLEHLLASESPQQAAKEFVQRLLRIRLRAQAWLQEFDAGLIGAQAGTDIFSLPSYQKLLVARPLAEHTEGKIISLYANAREISLGFSSDPAQREREGRAFLVVAGVHEALRETRKSPAQRVLLHDLFSAMKEKFGYGAQAFAGVFAPIQGNTLGETARKSAAEMQDLVRALPENDDVKEEIEAEAAKLAAALEARNTSAAVIYPSTGPAGNITGSTFPPGTYALTYDDGPHGSLTMANLSNLKSQGVKATFFWIANYAKNNVTIVRAVQAAGMAVANHSYMHAKVTSRSDLRRLDSDMDREIRGSTAELTRVYGVKPKYFRLPYAAGLDDYNVREMIASQGMVHVKWNIDSLDWQDRNPASITARVEHQMRMNGRGIILFHDVQEATVPASRSLLLRQKGRVRWVTIPEIVDELNGKARPKPPVFPDLPKIPEHPGNEPR